MFSSHRFLTAADSTDAPKELWSKTSDKICDDNALITTGTVIRCKNSNITEL